MDSIFMATKFLIINSIVMKHFKIPMLILIISFAFFSCSKDDEEDIINGNSQNKTEQSDARYYVRYEVYMPLGYSGQTTSKTITYVSEKGKVHFTTSEDSWEGTFGPIKKGTNVSLMSEATSGGIRNNVEYYIRLSVSRNQEPFVVKGEQRENKSVLYTSYTIDF